MMNLAPLAGLVAPGFIPAIKEYTTAESRFLGFQGAIKAKIFFD